MTRETQESIRQAQRRVLRHQRQHVGALVEEDELHGRIEQPGEARGRRCAARHAQHGENEIHPLMADIFAQQAPDAHT
mgnify:CR=1 FL=1